MDKKISTILLDWGDTVMIDFTGYTGPMADWPTVQLVDGIEESLKSLHNHYTICLATNAGASDKSLVNKALQRVGLDHYFDEIFTSKDLGFSKPQLQFYQEILNKIKVSGSECVMIGNDYQKDIKPAKKIGIWTIHFSKEQEMHSSADFTIPSMQQLVTTIKEIPETR